jgi:hypothetical protein
MIFSIRDQSGKLNNFNLNIFKRLSQKFTTSPRRSVGVLLLKEEEKVMILNINTFPSFPRRGVMPERA